MIEYSFTITQNQYNYLLPVFGIAAYSRTRLLCRHFPGGKELYFFIGTNEDYEYMLAMCKYLD